MKLNTLFMTLAFTLTSLAMAQDQKIENYPKAPSKGGYSLSVEGKVKYLAYGAMNKDETMLSECRMGFIKDLESGTTKKLGGCLNGHPKIVFEGEELMAYALGTNGFLYAHKYSADAHSWIQLSAPVSGQILSIKALTEMDGAIIRLLGQDGFIYNYFSATEIYKQASDQNLTIE